MEGKCHVLDVEVGDDVLDLGLELESRRDCVQLISCNGNRCTGQAAMVSSRSAPIMVFLDVMSEACRSSSS